MSQTDEFYLKQSEPNKACLLALRELIKSQDDFVTETINMACRASVIRKKCSVTCGLTKRLKTLTYSLSKANI